MRERNGFTLIELLAVIVILAVIALIATPIIIGIIEDSKVKANENSAYGIIDSAKYYYTQGLLKPENTIKYNENIIDELSYNGEKPKSGSWASVDKDGNVGIALLYGNKCYVKEYIDSKIKEGDPKDCKVSLPTTGPTLSEVIKKGPIVTTGSGLYKISDTEYRYRGGCTLNGDITCTDIDPINNYVSINGQKYRIIFVDSQGIKVISEKSLSTDIPFDARTTTTTGPRNNANNTFCQVTSTYYGCSVYASVSGNFTAGEKTGTVTQNSTLYDYLNTTSTDAEVTNLRDKAISVTWNIGAVIGGNAYTPLSTIIRQEKAATANFKLGLINTSDYINGSLNINCQNDALSDSGNSRACGKNNWLFDSTNSYPWTLNPWTNAVGYSSSVWHVYSVNGTLKDNLAYVGHGVRPVAYLSSNELVKSGDGTSANPWIIE